MAFCMCERVCLSVCFCVCAYVLKVCFSARVKHHKYDSEKARGEKVNGSRLIYIT